MKLTQVTPTSADRFFGQEITVVQSKDTAQFEATLKEIATQNGESVAWQQQHIDHDHVAFRYRFYKD
jgi:hypothetical protein